MVLNKGKILIDDKEICYEMDSKSFTDMFSCKIKNYTNGDIERYNFINPQSINELSLWVKVVFIKKTISSIELKNTDSSLKNSYNNWSDAKVKLKRKIHDEWLIKQLGEPHERKLPCIKYNYSWG